MSRTFGPLPWQYLLTILAGKAFAFGMELSTYDGAQGVGTALAYQIDRMSSIIGDLGAPSRAARLAPRPACGRVVTPGEIGWVGSAHEALPTPMNREFCRRR